MKLFFVCWSLAEVHCCLLRVGCCSLSCAVRCSLFVVCCALYVVDVYVLFVVGRLLLYDVRCVLAGVGVCCWGLLLDVPRCALFAGDCCLMFVVVCCLLCGAWCLLFVVC